ncbi:MAG: hypothetical protein L3J70_04590 [Gammaproteobacteria bacterium]|nr:hypothetical protein [Gammaproteobacteria bacterium]
MDFSSTSEQLDIFRRCVSLNTEIYKMVPLTKRMRLLSSNASCAAARAGSHGNTFRVLTQDIQLLSDDVSHCILSTRKIIDEVVSLSSKVVTLDNNKRMFQRILEKHEASSDKTPREFFSHSVDKMKKNEALEVESLKRQFKRLQEQLSPLKELSKKGQYLSVYSAVEAEVSEGGGESFQAVVNMLRSLVKILKDQSSKITSVLDEIILIVELKTA